jgi:sialidase-1
MKSKLAQNLFSLTLILICGTSALAKEERPNILFIASEDNGQELSCYGDKNVKAPHLDSLATEGILFESGYVTQSVCSPSRGTIFTGLMPHQNGQIPSAPSELIQRPGTCGFAISNRSERQLKKAILTSFIVSLLFVPLPAAGEQGEGVLKEGYPVPVKYVFKAGETVIPGVPDSRTRYGQFREPGIVLTRNGRLVLVTQARDHSKWPDRSGQDLVLRYSDDNGDSWSQPVLVAEHGNFSICPNAVVYDSDTDELHCLYNLFMWDFKIGANGRKELQKEGKLTQECRQYHVVSRDGGQGWSKPREITAMLGNSQGILAVFGSGRGIQLRHGPHKGRLCVPGGKRWDGWSNQIFYSDDHGKSWKLGAAVPPAKESRKISVRNECKVAECPDGTLVLNARSMPYRARAFSKDGGDSWTPFEYDEQLPTASSNAALISHEVDSKSYLVFSAPAGPGRENGYVWVSEDGGQTWPNRRLMLPDTVAYTSLSSMKDGRIALVYENEVYKHGSYRHLKLCRFRIRDVLGHKDALPRGRTDKNEGTYENEKRSAAATGHGEDSGSSSLKRAASFEEAKAGDFDTLQTAIGTWTPDVGRTVVDNEHADSGWIRMADLGYDDPQANVLTNR